MPLPPSRAAAAPATVLADYARLLAPLCAPLAGARLTLRVLPVRAAALPGERVEPWQLHGTLAALQAHGARLSVALPVAHPADPLADVCRRAGVAASGGDSADAELWLVPATPLGLASHPGARPPALIVADATTVCRRSALGRPQLAVRGAILAAGDAAALAAALRAEGTATPPQPLGAALVRLGGWRAAERLAYEDWVFNTGWGELYRAYQRRAAGRGG